MLSPSLLIRNGTLITLGPDPKVRTGCSLWIQNGIIQRIADESGFHEPFEYELDARGMVLLPGFINLHTHLYSAMACGMEGVPPSRDFVEKLQHLWWRLDKALTPEDCYYSALLLLINGIRHGVTTVFDHHASPGAIGESLEHISSAVKRTRIRACLCYEVSDRDGAEKARQGLEENAQFIRYCREANNPRLRALFGLHASFTLGDETLEAASVLGRELDCGFHIHAAESPADQQRTRDRHGVGVIERLHRFGLLGPRTIAAHCVHIDRREMEILGETGTGVAHNPQSNLNNAVGIGDLPGWQQAGIPVGLGTDGMTMNMTEELRTALWAQHLRAGNPSAAFLEVCRTLLLNNALIAQRHWDLPMGELKEGALADIVGIPYQPRTPLHDRNAYAHILYGISQEPVDTTIVGGWVLMHNRKLTIDVDEAEAAARCRELAARLYERMGA